MLKIEKELNGDTLNIRIGGRLDTITSTDLEKEIADFEGERIIFDCSDLDYISSAGLRVLLTTHKRIGNMVLKNISETVHEILEVTGFTDILTIE